MTYKINISTFNNHKSHKSPLLRAKKYHNKRVLMLIYGKFMPCNLLDESNWNFIFHILSVLIFSSCFVRTRLSVCACRFLSQIYSIASEKILISIFFSLFNIIQVASMIVSRNKNIITQFSHHHQHNGRKSWDTSIHVIEIY